MKNNRFSVAKALAALLLSVTAGAIVPAAGFIATAQAAPAVTGLPEIADLVDRAGPAVVNIRTTEKMRAAANGRGTSEDEELQELFRRFFGQPAPRSPSPVPRNRRGPQPEEEVQRGVGSGFIISADGYIMTNAHVVKGADEVYVKLLDKREFKAKVIGADDSTDVAVLKIEGSNLPRVTLGDSSKIRVGEWVIAIGSPFDLENTVTAGIISAKSRETDDLLPLIQTDVAVNPGNSGGPLINMRGEVIGINSQIYSRSGGYMGISFAVPIQDAMRIADQLKSSGRVSRGRMGVQMTNEEVSKDVAESLGLGKARGAQIATVDAGGPADKAGIQVGDIILKFNGVNIEKRIDLQRAVFDAKIGSKATVTVWRKGQLKEIALVVGEMEAERTARPGANKPKPKGDGGSNALGLGVGDLTEAQRRELRLDPAAGGVIVEAAGGAAAREGLQPGDVILRVDNTDIRDAKQFNALVATLDAKKNHVLLVRRGAYTQFIVIRPAAAP
ncbi:MAG TPA: Do family serine endopeptidase [Burkholderiaceae bacterium]